LALSVLFMTALVAQVPASSAASGSEASSAAAAAATAQVPVPPVQGWNGMFGLGLISLTGNANAVTVTANASAEWKSPEWTVAGKAFGTYGESRPAGTFTTQLVALAAGGQLRADRHALGGLSGYGLIGTEADHIKSVELRSFAEVGAAVVWIESVQADFTRAYIRTDLAFRYAREFRQQYYPFKQQLPDVYLVAPRLGLVMRFGLSEEVAFSEELEALPNLAGDFRVLINSVSKVTARLYQSLSLGISYQVNYDSLPAVGRRSTDTALSVGLEVGF
jgi:hypothetical protein